jgi:hypothetical protein
MLTMWPAAYRLFPTPRYRTRKPSAYYFITFEVGGTLGGYSLAQKDLLQKIVDINWKSGLRQQL